MTRPHPSNACAPTELAAPPDTTLPNGLAVELAADVRRSRDGRLMLGGAGVMSRRARHVLITVAAIEAMIDYRRSGVRLDPLRYLLIRRLDDMAYGVGVWRGVIRDRTTAPLIPRLALTIRH